MHLTKNIATITYQTNLNCEVISLLHVSAAVCFKLTWAFTATPEGWLLECSTGGKSFIIWSDKSKQNEAQPKERRKIMN